MIILFLLVFLVKYLFYMTLLSSMHTSNIKLYDVLIINLTLLEIINIIKLVY